MLGLGFFLLNLVPFIGLNAGSYMNYSWVMDHMLYLPMIGLIGLASAAVGDVAGKLTPLPRRIGAAMIALIIALLTWTSHGYAALYASLEALWSHNIALNPDAALLTTISAWPTRAKAGSPIRSCNSASRRRSTRAIPTRITISR